MDIKTAQKMVRILAGLFPNQVSQEQSKLYIREFQAFEERIVYAAIIEHRKSPDLKGGFLDFGKLLEGCQSNARGAAAASRPRTSIADQSFASVYRQQRPDLAGAGDYEVILRILRGFWFRASARESDVANLDREKSRAIQTVDGEIPAMICIEGRIGSFGYERKFRRECEYALIGAGMLENEAADWARFVFIQPQDCAEWLNIVRDMRPPTEAVRNSRALTVRTIKPIEFKTLAPLGASFEAIKQLAVVEHQTQP